MRVHPPSNNQLTQGFSGSHPGYDHDDIPDRRYFASFTGTVAQVINTFSTSWIANKPSDPYYTNGNRPLRTEDYGNYLKIEGQNGITQLGAHFPKNGFLVKEGDQVGIGQMVAVPPDTSNDTGNSTGGHTHTEYRDGNNNQIAVQFTKPIGDPGMPDKKYTEEEMTEMRLQRDHNWDLYKQQKKRASELLTQLQEREKRVEELENLLSEEDAPIPNLNDKFYVSGFVVKRKEDV